MKKIIFSVTIVILIFLTSIIKSSTKKVDIEIFDNSASSYVVIGNDIPIPANSTLSFITGQKIVLAESDKVAVKSSSASSLNAIASILEDI